MLCPKVTALRPFAVGEVALSQDEPLSVDLRMFPERPATTNTPLPERPSVVEALLPLEIEPVDEED